MSRKNLTLPDFQPLEAPNASSVSNIILDLWMSELSGAEFKVVSIISRIQNIKMSADFIDISISEFSKRAGLAENSIRAAIKRLLARGYIEKINNFFDDQGCATSSYRFSRGGK